jgi:hypothetical protein
MRITVESRVKDIVERYPSTGLVFIQAGPLYVNQPRELYARFPDLSVGELAERNGSDLAALLKQLEAVAEAEEAMRGAPAAKTVGRRDYSLTLGYTGSYRPREDAAPQKISVVAAQSAHGPE